MDSVIQMAIDANNGCTLEITGPNGYESESFFGLYDECNRDGVLKFVSENLPHEDFSDENGRFRLTIGIDQVGTFEDENIYQRNDDVFLNFSRDEITYEGFPRDAHIAGYESDMNYRNDRIFVSGPKFEQEFSYIRVDDSFELDHFRSTVDVEIQKEECSFSRRQHNLFTRGTDWIKDGEKNIEITIWNVNNNERHIVGTPTTQCSKLSKSDMCTLSVQESSVQE